MTEQRRTLGLAALAALLAAAGHALYLRSAADTAQGGQPIEALYVTQDIAPGAPLTDEHLDVREIPAAFMDPRHVPAQRLSDVLERPAAAPLAAGQSLLWGDVKRADGPRTLADVLETGQRAIAIDSGSFTLAQLLRPGDRVDLLLTRDDIDGPTTQLLLEHVLVLALGQQLMGGPSPAGAEEGAGYGEESAVTLAVSTDDAKLIAAAEARGTLRLVLRNRHDVTVSPSELSARPALVMSDSEVTRVH